MGKGKKKMTGELQTNCVCRKCNKSLGEFTWEEFCHWSDDQGDSGLCFDCEGEFKYFTQSSTWGAIVGDTVFLGGMEFWVNRNINGELRWRTQSHAHDRTRAQSYLSSSTNLNAALSEDNQETVVFSGKSDCPKCQVGRLFLLGDVKKCDSCNSYFDNSTGESYPSWRRFPSERFLEELSEIDFCDACERVQLGGAGRYCAHHHALLIEQHEDGSLGWNNE